MKAKLNQIKAFIKYVLSFFKRDWTLYDYPLRFRIQKGVCEESRWSIQIINWWVMNGLGPTKSIALRELKEMFEIHVQAEGYKPRPGIKVPIEFAKTDEVRKNYGLLIDFIEKILGFSREDPVFISDKATLWNFSTDDNLEEYYKKIEEVYGEDVRGIKDANIAKILDQIARQSGAEEMKR
jgi:hypothetical protein